MRRVLLITVRYHDGRYHGAGDWPPSPARLFQALVAGVGHDGPLDGDTSRPLEWLEGLDPPVIAAPHMAPGTTIPMHFVPNNDLDAIGGFARNLPKTRTAVKAWKPKLFDPAAAFYYAWEFDEADGGLGNAKRICDFAERLYQLGRGIDQAWAAGEVTESEKLQELMSAYQGVVHRPTGGQHGTVLACPQPGSLKSLKDRYGAMSQRFQRGGEGRSINLRFTQAPKPRFRQIAYGSPPCRQLFELRSPSDQNELLAWPLSRISALVVAVRDGVVARLKRALPDQESQVERCLIGRKADGSNAVPKAARVRIVPLPSIGHAHADHAIRRVVVEVPGGCLLRSDDVFWAVSGLELAGPGAADAPGPVLTTTVDDSMLRHYGVRHHAYTRWRTVSPAALPEAGQRRRIEPSRRSSEAKGGIERAEEQRRAAREVLLALRHAEIRAVVDTIRVQREPLDANGERAEAFAQATRFPKERLWHVDLILAEPLAGPLVIGDGRYWGLGLMAPVKSWEVSDDQAAEP